MTTRALAACPQLPYELMRKTEEAALELRPPSRAVDILTISDNPRLSSYLSRLFDKSGWTSARARTCQEAITFLRENRAAVAVCEESLPDGFWHDSAAAFRSLSDAPSLVVVSDHRALAYEVMALGGFDVLVRPLRDRDVIWTVASAWHAWMKRVGGRGKGGP
jgi:DNA-binding NtrC family response regulator